MYQVSTKRNRTFLFHLKNIFLIKIYSLSFVAFGVLIMLVWQDPQIISAKATKAKEVENYVQSNSETPSTNSEYISETH